MQDTDLLISRIVDGCANRTDWDNLTQQAAQRPTLWHDLAMAQRDEQLLSHQVRRETSRAMMIEIPTSTSRVNAQQDHTYELSRRTGLVRSWAGWGIAAMLGLAFISNRMGVPLSSENTTNGSVAALNPLADAADALQTYLTKGQQEGTVVGEQSKLNIIGVTPVEGGSGFDVLYERTIVERARVENLYRLAQDETGQPAAVQVPLSQLQRVITSPMSPPPQTPRMYRKPAV